MSSEFYESTEPDRDDGYDDGADADWEGSYSDRDGITADESSETDEDDVLPEFEADAERPVVTEQDVEGFRRASEYLDSVSRRASGSFFVATVDREAVPDAEEAGDSLAAFDTPDTERGREEFDQRLNTMPYQSALNAAGVQLNDDPFRPHLELTDGRRFAAALAAMPEGDEVLRKGAESVVRHAIIKARNAYVPTFLADEYHSNHRWPALLPEVADEPARARANADLVAEVSMNAHEMAPELRRLGVDAGWVEDVDALKLAVDEGMVPQWAVASEWKLFHQPTTNAHDHVWTRWLTDADWQRVTEYLDAAAAVAPPDSRFMSNLASTMLTNMDRLRRGDLAESRRPQMTDLEIDPDDDFVEIDFEDTIDPTQLEEDRRRYETRLVEVEQRLRQFVR